LNGSLAGKAQLPAEVADHKVDREQAVRVINPFR